MNYKRFKEIINNELKRGDCNMQAATMQLESLTCPSCMQKSEGAIKSVDGVDQDTVKILFNSSKVKLNFDEDKVTVDEIENAITKVGYEVKKTKVKSV